MYVCFCQYAFYIDRRYYYDSAYADAAPLDFGAVSDSDDLCTGFFCWVWFDIGSGKCLFRDIGHLYSVFTTAWMYLTPIIYPMEVLENMPSWIVVVVKCNPLYHYINFFRQVVMEGTVPTLFTHLICAVTAAAFLAVGLFVFKKAQDRFILYV